MKASIVIPAYNEEKWIGTALDATILQTYPDYEIIVVDNASIDKTSEIVKKYTEKDVRIKLVSEKRKGLLFAREAGRLAASGEIIVQLDADCRPHVKWLEIGMSLFKNDDVVAATGPYHYYDADKTFNTITALGQEYIFAPTHKMIRVLGYGGFLTGGNAFIRASALEKIGGYDTSIDFYSEDTDTGFKLSKIGKVIYRSKLAVDSSARRFKAFGFKDLGTKYGKAFLSVLQGKKTKDHVENVHPR